jgi:hypothetical protein
VARVAGLLKDASDLSKLEQLKATTRAKFVQWETQVNATVKASLDDAAQTLSLLGDGQALIGVIKANFDKVSRLSVDTADLIADYELVQRVNTTRNNVQRTLHDAEQMLQIPSKIDAVREALADESYVLQLHGAVRELESQRDLVMAQISDSHGEFYALKKTFRFVEELSNGFEAMLWKIVDNYIDYARERPSVLVKVAQVIWREEQWLAQRIDHMEPGERDAASKVPRDEGQAIDGSRNYKSLFFSHLRIAIHERFARLFEDFNSDVKAALKSADEILDDMTLLHDDAVPCFPDEWNMFDFFAQEYHVRWYHMLVNFASNAEANPEGFDTRGLLLLMQWVRKDYRLALARLGLTDMEPDLFEALEGSFNSYCIALRELMSQWNDRIIESDLAQGDDAIDEMEGRLYTLAPTQFFESVNQQIDLARKTKYPVFILAVVREVQASIRLFHGKLVNLIHSHQSMSLAYAVALVNNNDRSCDHTYDLAEHIRSLADKQAPAGSRARPAAARAGDDDDDNDAAADAADADAEDNDEDGASGAGAGGGESKQADSAPLPVDDEQVQLSAEEAALQELACIDFDNEAKGFHMVAKAALEIIINQIFADLEPAFEKCCSDGWLDNPISDIAATFQEYFSDQEEACAHLDETYFSKLTERCLQRAVQRYLAALLSDKRPLPPNGSDLVDDDVVKLRECFSEFLREKAVSKRISVLAEFAGLLECAAEAVPLYFQNLLKRFPDIRVDHVRTLLTRREGLSKHELEDAIVACDRLRATADAKGPRKPRRKEGEADEDENAFALADKHADGGGKTGSSLLDRIRAKVLGSS